MVRIPAVVAVLVSLVLSAAPVRAAEEGPAAAAALTVTTPAPARMVVPVAARYRTPAGERSLVLPSLYVSLGALQAYDVYSTLTALQGGASEANPLMQGVVGNPAAFIALKVGVTGASIYAAERLWKQQKRTQAILLMAASNGLMAYVAHHNARVLGTLR